MSNEKSRNSASFDPDLVSYLILSQFQTRYHNHHHPYLRFLAWEFSCAKDFYDYGPSYNRCSHSDYKKLIILLRRKCRSHGEYLSSIRFNRSEYGEFIKGAHLVHDPYYLNTSYAFKVYCVKIDDFSPGFRFVLVNSFYPVHDKKQQAESQFINRLSDFSVTALIKIQGLLRAHDEYDDKVSRFKEIMIYDEYAFEFSHIENGASKAAIFSCKDEAESSVRKHIVYLITKKLAAEKIYKSHA